MRESAEIWLLVYLFTIGIKAVLLTPFKVNRLPNWDSPTLRQQRGNKELSISLDIVER